MNISFRTVFLQKWTVVQVHQSIVKIVILVLLSMDLSAGMLDTDYPILLSDLFGSTGGQFGYSVTLMKSTHPDFVKGWVLIGAPKSNSPFLPKVDEPGVIWRCSLGRSRNNETCEILNLDPNPSPNGQECTAAKCQDYPHSESKFQNFLGVSMSSTDNDAEGFSGRFVTCAHRWTRGQGTLMNGICYFLPSSDVNKYFDTPRESLIDLKTYKHRLIPFFEGPNGPNQRFPLSNNETSLKWTVGQAGISTHLSKKDFGLELLIGAPGVYVWSGAVIRYQDGTQRPGSFERKNRYGSSDFASFMISSRPLTNSNWHELFGYAVTSGKFDSSGQTLYVGGAPRGGDYLNGEVVVFKFPAENKPQQEIIEEIEVLGGKQIGSYFGSVLLAVDINGDGIDELFVAAPLFSREIGSNVKVIFRKGSGRSVDVGGTATPEDINAADAQNPSNFGILAGDQGCVYMYRERDIKGESAPIKLFGNENHSPGARFGSAMTSLGDINGDTLNDIAIGAPYENDGLGAIYIFYGTKDSNKLQQLQYSQRITPLDIITLPVSAPHPLLGFGSSFSSGVDIDQNGTPDLAIGSYLSGKAVVLRTRQVLQIEGDVRFFVNQIQVTILPSKAREFVIRTGVKYTPKLGRRTEPLKVNVTLVFDPQYDRFEITPRVNNIFRGNNPREWRYEDWISSSSDIKYHALEARLKKEHNDSDPNLPPFIVQQRIGYNDITNEKRKGVRHFEIRANNLVKMADNSPDFDTFCSTCVGKGESKPESFELVISNEECFGSQCLPELRVNAAFRLPGKDNLAKISKFILGSAKSVVLEINVQNVGQTATKPTIEIKWEQNLRILDLPAFCSDPTYLTPWHSTTCSLGEHLRNNKSKTVELNFNMDDIYASRPEERFGVDVEALTYKDGVKDFHGGVTADLLLVTDTQVKIFGSPLNRVVWNTKFRHVYEVRLDGHSHVETVSLNFKIPVNITEGNVRKQVLLVTQPDHEQYKCTVKHGSYAQIEGPTERPDETTGGTPTQPDVDYESDHELELSKKKIAAGRHKRDVPINSRIYSKLEKIKPNANTFEFACRDNAKVECMEIECMARNMKREDTLTITFEFTIVNETASELLKSMEKSSMLIESKGFAKIITLGSQDKDTTQTLLETIPPGEIAVWIYIVAAIGGILILVILVTVLYKVGFFKRETKKQLEELKAAREEVISTNARQSLIMAAAIQDEIRQSKQLEEQVELDSQTSQAKENSSEH